MDDLITSIINELKSIDIDLLKNIKNEPKFQEYVVKRLDTILKNDIILKTEDKSYKEGRQTRPDISIGLDDILIELKFDLKNLNGIYRLYYQAIKYSKKAKRKLILCVHDPRNKLLTSDIKDLENIEKVKVVHLT